MKHLFYLLLSASLLGLGSCDLGSRVKDLSSISDPADTTTANSTTPPAATPPATNVRYSSKPDMTRMESDLVGRTITEGKAEGYHRADWTYTIEHGQISQFEITKTIVDDQDLYIVEATMNITPSDASYYYYTTLKLTYVDSSSNGWILDNVSSLGMDVVSNGAYDDCISSRIADDGWGGTYALYIRNNCDSNLIVGGRVLTSGGWKRFSSIVGAHEENSVGGVMSGGSVDNYVIDFVIKEY